MSDEEEEDDEVEDEISSISLNDFVLVDESLADDNIRDVPFLNELKTSPAKSTETTMFVTQRAQGIPFVLKRITPDSFSGGITKLMLAHREAKALRQLHHVNIVDVHEVFTESGHLYVLQEFVTGRNVASAIRQQSGVLLQEDLVVGWFRQLVTGLCYLHKKYVVHGNIKPENVLLSDNQKMVRLSDFGLTKVFECVGVSIEARPGYSVSQLYTAPETLHVQDIASDDEEALLHHMNDDAFGAGEKADVWSLGVVIYEMLALKRPFNSIRTIVTKEADLLPGLYGDNLVNAVGKMLKKRPWQRIDTVQLSQEAVFGVKRVLKTQQDISIIPEDSFDSTNATSEEFDQWRESLADGIDKDSSLQVALVCRQAAERSTSDLHALLAFCPEIPKKESYLHQACRYNKFRAVQALCDAGASVIGVNEDGDLPIHVASLEGNDQCLKVLLDKSLLDKDAKGDAGRTPLIMAVSNNHQNVVEMLLDRGAGPNEPSVGIDDSKATPLHFACLFGFLGCARLLLKGGADPTLADANGDQPLHVAARCGKSSLCAFLIESGADKEAFGYHGRTPLFCAINNGYPEVVEELIRQGVDINSKNRHDKQKRTPLHLAVARSNLQIVSILIANNVAWLRADTDGNTALHLAVLKGYAALVEMFLDRRLNVDTVNEQNGWTPLHTAAASGQQYCTRLLLKRGADVEAISHVSDGCRTPLHVAIMNSQVDTARLLLQNNASILAKNDATEGALQMAVTNDKPEMIRLLVDNFKANVDIRTSHDLMTPLHHACRLDRYYAAKALLEQNANVELRDSFGHTPFAIAVINGSAVCAELLWSWGADTQAANTVGNLPIHLAVLQSKIDLISFLVRRCRVNTEVKGQHNLTPLQLAIRENNETAVAMLLKVGADKDVKSEDAIAQTPLHMAASMGYPNVVSLLLKAGSKVDQVNWRDETPLMLAVKSGNDECALVLLRDGKANVEKIGHLGRRVINYAIEGRSIQCVKLVAVDYNASLDEHDDAKETPFEMTARLGYADVGAVLLGKQGDLINHVNEQGETALHIAARYGQLGFVQFLVEQGSKQQ